MALETKYHTLFLENREFQDNGVFGTIAELQAYMKFHEIPEDAIIEYAGCGSHNIAFEWEVEVELDPFDSIREPV